MKLLNRKGFTLVELLAVLVIMIAISSIAISSISAALERSKGNQNKQKIKLLESAAEVYVSEHKNSISDSDYCISVDTLLNGGYIDEDNIKDANGDLFSGGIEINANDFTYNKNLSSGARGLQLRSKPL